MINVAAHYATVREAAQALKVSQSRVRQWVSANELETYRWDERTVLIDRESLVRFQERRRQELLARTP